MRIFGNVVGRIVGQRHRPLIGRDGGEYRAEFVQRGGAIEPLNVRRVSD